MLSKYYSLIGDERDLISNLANTSAYFYYNLPNINWIGFYFVKNDILQLGPFQGKPACVRLSLNKGVCACAVKLKKIQNIPDVHKFDSHIACDSASLSEIVIPIIINNKIVAVLDVDSPIINRFLNEDEVMLKKVCKFLENNCDW